MLVEIVAAIVLQNFVVHTREDTRPIVIIILAPAIERMIVALRTLQTNAKEHLRCGLRPRHGIAQRTIIIRRRIQIRAAPRRDDFTNEHVHRLVFQQRLRDPTVKRLDALAIDGLLLRAKEVAPFQRPEFGKLRPPEQFIHEPRSLAFSRISDKGARFVR